jgi:hypothetical protein
MLLIIALAISGAFIPPMTTHIVSVTLWRILPTHFAQKSFKVGEAAIIGEGLFVFLNPLDDLSSLYSFE